MPNSVKNVLELRKTHTEISDFVNSFNFLRKSGKSMGNFLHSSNEWATLEKQKFFKSTKDYWGVRIIHDRLLCVKTSQVFTS